MLCIRALATRPCSHLDSSFSRWRSPLPRLKPPHRTLHLAPPFLLDSHTPRNHLLSPAAVARKRDQAHAHLRNCNLCPRRCGVDRLHRAGACLIQGNAVRVGTIAPHFGEEPCIQGHNGSGSVFFAGCNLRCVFCQNHDIAHTRAGFELSPEELAAWMVKLQGVGGVHNVNFVTPEHVVPQVVLAVLAAREMGCTLPVVYNTSAYDSLESIELLDGIVDVYLPDFKAWREDTARRLLKAGDYAVHAREAVRAMHGQVGDLCFTPDGLAKSGVLVRHLVMPGLEEEGAEIVRWLAREVSRDAVVHVMEQYFPRAHVGKERRGRNSKGEDKPDVVEPGGVEGDDRASVRYADINRPVEEQEVSRVRQAAEEAGLWRFVDAAQHGGFNI